MDGHPLLELATGHLDSITIVTAVNNGGEGVEGCPERTWWPWDSGEGH